MVNQRRTSSGPLLVVAVVFGSPPVYINSVDQPSLAPRLAKLKPLPLLSGTVGARMTWSSSRGVADLLDLGDPLSLFRVCVLDPGLGE